MSFAGNHKTASLPAENDDDEIQIIEPEVRGKPVQASIVEHDENTTGSSDVVLFPDNPDLMNRMDEFCHHMKESAMKIQSDILDYTARMTPVVVKYQEEFTRMQAELDRETTRLRMMAAVLNTIFGPDDMIAGEGEQEQNNMNDEMIFTGPGPSKKPRLE